MNTTKQRRQHVAKIHKCNVTWLNVTQQCKFNFEKSARCEYVIINQIEGLKRVTQMSNSVGFHLTTHCMLPAACHHHNSSNETMGPPAPQSYASVLPMVILPWYVIAAMVNAHHLTEPSTWQGKAICDKTWKCGKSFPAGFVPFKRSKWMQVPGEHPRRVLECPSASCQSLIRSCKDVSSLSLLVGNMSNAKRVPF